MTLKLYNDLGLVIRTRYDWEWPVHHVFLDNGVAKLSSDESFGIENSVQWVLGGLVVGGITNQSFILIKSDIRSSSSVSLVVRYYFYPLILPDTDRWEGGTEIDTDGFTDWFLIRHNWDQIKILFLKQRFFLKFIKGWNLRDNSN